jgi:hypothetical protein
MPVESWLAMALAVSGALVAGSVVAAHTLGRRSLAGDEDKGIVLFVESIRWIGIPWGLLPMARGLRRAGFEGTVRYWRWHATWRGVLVLPALMAPRMLEAQARRLANHLAGLRRDHPDRPIYLVGYSCGAWVTVRALELMEDELDVDGAALLAGAVAPSRDLARAAGRVRGRLVVASSLADAVIIGAGTWLFGTGDRVRSVSMGMVGPAGALPANGLHVPWRPRDIADGHFGGHFSAAAGRHVARRIAPALLAGQSADLGS